MIKLDWDNFSYKKMIDKVEEIKLFGFVKQITVYSSPSLNGYHCVIIPFFKLKPNVIFQYRYDFEDDKNRLLLDMLSNNQKVRNVLFDYKIKTKFGKSMKFERKELFKYKRTTNLSEWQKIPKELTKNFKQELLQ
tara:strand:- start:9 stop:413 length:405 start_codon:yes stop_codon:yes gene_type:complete